MIALLRRLLRLRPRKRYAVVQVAGDTRTVLASGLSHHDAAFHAAQSNQMLRLFKAMAPSGPQDARAVIEEMA